MRLYHDEFGQHLDLGAAKPIPGYEWPWRVQCPSRADGETGTYGFADSSALAQAEGEGTDIPCCWDEYGNHKGGRNVAWWSGKVEFLSEDEFQRVIEKNQPRVGTEAP